MAIGLASLLVALCFAEVGSRFERTGGPYLYTRAAFGRFVGFEVGWMQWVTRVTSQAGVANGIVLALGFYWPAFTTGAGRAITLAAITLAMGWINLRGIRLSAFVIDFFTIAKLLPLTLFILVGLWFVDASRLSPSGAVSLTQISTAALLLIFAFGGYDVIGVPAGEAADPRRHLPFAFVATILTVTAVMTMAQIVALGTLPNLLLSKTPLADASMLFVGAAGALHHQRRIGRVDDGQQPRRCADRFAHALCARRERRAAALLRKDSPALPHAVQCCHLYHASGAGPRIVWIVRHTGCGQRGRSAYHLHRRMRGDAPAAIQAVRRECQPGDVRDSIGSRGAGPGHCRVASDTRRRHARAAARRRGRAGGRSRAISREWQIARLTMKDKASVFVASGEIHAQQVQGFLEAAGIASELKGEALRKTHGLTIDGLGMVEVIVSSEDEAQARALLASAELGAFRLDDDAKV